MKKGSKLVTLLLAFSMVFSILAVSVAAAVDYSDANGRGDVARKGEYSQSNENHAPTDFANFTKVDGITIDGDVDEAWAKANVYQIAQPVTYGSQKGTIAEINPARAGEGSDVAYKDWANKITATMRGMYDGNLVYILVDVNDVTIVSNREGATGDRVEFSIAPPTCGATAYYAITPTESGAIVTMLRGKDSSLVTASAKFKTDENGKKVGYIVEMAIDVKQIVAKQDNVHWYRFVEDENEDPKHYYYRDWNNWYREGGDIANGALFDFNLQVIDDISCDGDETILTNSTTRGANTLDGIIGWASYDLDLDWGRGTGRVYMGCKAHTWGETTVTKEPTKKEEGLGNHTCSVCGLTEETTIAKLPVYDYSQANGLGDIARKGEYSQSNENSAPVDFARFTKVSVAPTVDGLVDEAWAKASVYQIAQPVTYGSQKGTIAEINPARAGEGSDVAYKDWANKITATMRGMWDGNYVYILVDVNDVTIVSNREGATGDRVEFSIAPPTCGATAYYAITPTESGAIVTMLRGADASLVTASAKFKTDENGKKVGYIVEMAIDVKQIVAKQGNVHWLRFVEDENAEVKHHYYRDWNNWAILEEDIQAGALFDFNLQVIDDISCDGDETILTNSTSRGANTLDGIIGWASYDLDLDWGRGTGRVYMACEEHSFGKLTVVEEPTYTDAGSGTHTCSVCGLTETVTIPKLVYDYSQANGLGDLFRNGEYTSNNQNHTPTDFAHFTKVSAAPTVDGLVDAAWANANVYQIAQPVTYGSQKGTIAEINPARAGEGSDVAYKDWADKITATMRGMYDDNYVYILVDVNDVTIVSNREGATGDRVEFSIAPPTCGATAYYAITPTENGAIVTMLRGADASLVTASAKFKTDENGKKVGYIVEMAIDVKQIVAKQNNVHWYRFLEDETAETKHYYYRDWNNWARTEGAIEGGALFDFNLQVIDDISCDGDETILTNSTSRGADSLDGIIGWASYDLDLDWGRGTGRVYMACEEHTWGAVTATKEATHLEDGVGTHTCSVCGLTETVVIPKVEEHTYETYTKQTADQHKKTCACGESVLEDHTWGDQTVIVAPTADEPGSAKVACTLCGEEKTVVLPVIRPYDYSAADKQTILWRGGKMLEVSNEMKAPVDFAYFTKLNGAALTIDGVMDDAWAKATVYDIANDVSYGSQPGTVAEINPARANEEGTNVPYKDWANKITATMRGMWDGNYVYILVDVNDTTIVSNRTGATGDRVEFSIAPPACGGSAYYMITPTENGAIVTRYNSTDATLTGLVKASSKFKTDDEGNKIGYIVEMAIDVKQIVAKQNNVHWYRYVENEGGTATDGHFYYRDWNDWNVFGTDIQVGGLFDFNIQVVDDLSRDGDETILDNDPSNDRASATLDGIIGWATDSLDMVWGRETGRVYMGCDEHEYGEVTVVKAPTHTEEGLSSRVCKNCGLVEEGVTIPTLPDHEYNTYEILNDTQHKKICGCGDEIIEDHTFGEVAVIVAPTTESEGRGVASCSACGKTKAVILPKLTETPEETKPAPAETETAATPTAEETETTATKPQEAGCNSSLTALPLMILLGSCAVAVCYRKKED